MFAQITTSLGDYKHMEDNDISDDGTLNQLPVEREKLPQVRFEFEKLKIEANSEKLRNESEREKARNEAEIERARIVQ